MRTKSFSLPSSISWRCSRIKANKCRSFNQGFWRFLRSSSGRLRSSRTQASVYAWQSPSMTHCPTDNTSSASSPLQRATPKSIWDSIPQSLAFSRWVVIQMCVPSTSTSMQMLARLTRTAFLRWSNCAANWPLQLNRKTTSQCARSRWLSEWPLTPKPFWIKFSASGMLFVHLP